MTGAFGYWYPSSLVHGSGRVIIDLYTSADISGRSPVLDGDPTVDGVYEPTVSSFDTYKEQQAACKAEGKRLCTLDELCPTQGVLGFDIRGNIGDSWVAYDGTDTCGCADNAWVQIGNWGGLGSTCKTHCEVTAEFYDAPTCPEWGTVDGEGYTPNSYICCSVHYDSCTGDIW